MKLDAVAIGECLIDFIPYGRSTSGQPLYERNPGGAPVNVMAALSKLGIRTSFIGKVGNDPLGRYLGEMLKENGVGDEGLVYTSDAHTTLAFVHLDDNGERSFHFARQPGADQGILYEEIPQVLLNETRLFHFGSISMTAEPAYRATLQSVRQARRNGALISYDPNWRPALWKDTEHAASAIKEGLKLADLVKVSEEELEFITGASEIETGAQLLLEQYSLTLLLVTLGDKGTYYRFGEFEGYVSSFKVTTIDTTGAGDGFLGAFLYRVLTAETDLAEWRKEQLENALRFANAAGALATTRKGAIPSLADCTEIENLVKSRSGE